MDYPRPLQVVPMRRTVRWLAAWLALVCMTACLQLAGPTRDSQETAAANTLSAQVLINRLTLAAGQTAVAQLTEQAPTSEVRTPPPKGPSPTPAATFIEFTETPLPPLPTSTPLPLPPTATIPAIPCNQAVLVQDVNLPSGAQLPIGSSFTKIWRVMNSGSCAWSNDYSLVYTGGNLTAPVPTVFFPATVSPGGVIDLAVTLQAPAYPGDFQGYWMLSDPSAGLFGVSPGLNTPLELSIRTFQSSFNSGSYYDLAVNYCAATWVSRAGLLDCPGTASDPEGTILLIQNPVFETLPRSGYGLLTRPDNSSNGMINGQFLPYTVQSGDVFLSEIGCLQNSPGCRLTFRLDYQTADGQTGSLGTWQETYDGFTTQVEINLSSLAGRMVWFNLQAVNRGTWQDANAFWHQPRIQSGRALNTPVLTWSRTGDPDSDACQELIIRLDGFNRAVAEAYNCRSGMRQLGMRGLDSDELNQIQDWLQRLGEVNAELYSAGQPDPVVIWIDFQGLGQSSGTEADLRAISSFAASIYDSVAR